MKTENDLLPVFFVLANMPELFKDVNSIVRFGWPENCMVTNGTTSGSFWRKSVQGDDQSQSKIRGL